MEPEREYTQLELLEALKPLGFPSEYADKTKADLQSVLDGLGVSYTAATNKADLIALIQANKVVE